MSPADVRFGANGEVRAARWHGRSTFNSGDDAFSPAVSSLAIFVRRRPERAAPFASGRHPKTLTN